MSAQYEELQQELRDIKRLLHGDPTTGKGGLAHSVLRIGDDMYGTDRQPGGLLSDMNDMKRYKWIVFGVVIAAQFGIQILFKFWP